MSHHSARGPIPIRTANPPSHQPTTASLPLRALIQKLTSLTSTSHSLCHTIRTNRNLSAKGTAIIALNALETSLSDALPHLSSLYNTLRDTHGKRLDVADASSLAALDAAVNTLNKHVKARLAEVAGSKSKKPGFSDILATFNTVIDSVEETLSALSAHLSAASAPAPAPRPKATPVQDAPHRPRRNSRTRESEAPRVLKEGEIAIEYSQFERMHALMQASWIEEVAEGARRFRNMADPKWVVYGVVPEGGFVRAL